MLSSRPLPTLLQATPAMHGTGSDERAHLRDTSQADGVIVATLRGKMAEFGPCPDAGGDAPFRPFVVAGGGIYGGEGE